MTSRTNPLGRQTPRLFAVGFAGMVQLPPVAVDHLPQLVLELPPLRLQALDFPAGFAQLLLVGHLFGHRGLPSFFADDVGPLLSIVAIARGVRYGAVRTEVESIKVDART